MLRIVSLNILPGMLLTAYVIGICSATVEAQNIVPPASKQMYSNRAIGYTVPTPYYGTPMMPIFIPPPGTPPFMGQSGMPPFMGPPGTPSSFQVAQADMSANPVTPLTFAPAVVEPPAPRTFELTHAVPRVNVDDELDALYARLAKIHLEKHQLDETLAFVKSIKSEVNRVRTLVDLAEYVSRDKNYQSEAEELYRLALAGIEALEKRFDSPPAAPVPPVPVENVDPAPEVQPPTETERPSPILLQDDSAKRKGNGKLPPPSPPRGNGVDGGLERIVGSL